MTKANSKKVSLHFNVLRVLLNKEFLFIQWEGGPGSYISGLILHVHRSQCSQWRSKHNKHDSHVGKVFCAFYTISGLLITWLVPQRLSMPRTIEHLKIICLLSRGFYSASGKGTQIQTTWLEHTVTDIKHLIQNLPYWCACMCVCAH